MKIKNKLAKNLESIGATLDDGDYALNCDAPSGYVWRANRCRVISIPYANNSQSWLAKAIQDDGLPRLRLGLVKVTDADELESIRNEIDDDDWGASDDAPEFIAWT